jgi:hypothetical protein
MTPSILEDFLPAFLGNLISALVLVLFIYHQAAQRREFVFTFLSVSTSVFLLCRLLIGVELDLAFALGLFAIFGIIRYRTDAIPIREMTYLFLVIALAVINALASGPDTWSVVLVANGTIWGLTWVLERLWKLRHLATKIVIYDRVDLIHTGRRDELIADLSRRTGVVIEKIEIGKVDLLRDTAVIKVFFDANVVPGHFETPGETE